MSVQGKKSKKKKKKESDCAWRYWEINLTENIFQLSSTNLHTSTDVTSRFVWRWLILCLTIGRLLVKFSPRKSLYKISFYFQQFIEPSTIFLISIQCFATVKCSSFCSEITIDFMYRIMYELAVCSDGMTEAQPRSFRQNRPASEYIIWHNAHSPANRCSGCSTTCTWKRKKNVVW